MLDERMSEFDTIGTPDIAVRCAATLRLIAVGRVGVLIPNDLMKCPSLEESLNAG